MANLTEVINQSFAQYAGAVIQSRALVDVRDILKPSARQIFYSMYTHKLTSDNPTRKTTNAIGMAMVDFYIHGDASCEGIIMRAAQDFAMRYPLVDVTGNKGTLIESGNWAASRYTESRLSKIADCLFDGIKDGCISEWRDNYDNTKQYPAVLPSKGFYNICNGSMGIATAVSSSIPQYNLVEVNNALIRLLWDENAPDEEITCMPDFATGAILLNADEVRESMLNGTGKSCMLRSVIEYDEKERALVVKEIPYGVYTNTICKQLEEIINERNIGIERFNDLTGATPLIKIYLHKSANPENVLKFLYKNTSLQSYYGINFTMLENGRYPKIFTWREALLSHLAHEREVYTRSFENELDKIQKRLHIIDGIIIAIQNIERVIEIIKKSASTAAAQSALMQEFNLSDVQAKAILDIKLARLARLEVSKYVDERNALASRAEELNRILSDNNLLNKEIEKGLIAVRDKYGDARRTQVMNLSTDEDEPIERRMIVVNLTNKGTLYAYESNTLIAQKRAGKGVKVKLQKDEYIVDSVKGENDGKLLLFSNSAKVYSVALKDISLETIIYPETIIGMSADEHICNMCLLEAQHKQYIVFTTKNGLVKKSKLSDYNIRRGGVTAIKLRENDEIINISFVNDEPLGILTHNGNFLMIDTTLINAIGRVASGVQGIKLSAGDYVVCARTVPQTAIDILTCSSAAIAKISTISEYNIGTRATKGAIAQKTREDDHMACFLPLSGQEKEVILTTSTGIIKIPISQIQRSGRTTIGTQLKKLAQDETATSIAIEL